MISKIKSDITIEKDKLKKHEIISLVHDDNFQITIKKGQFYQDIYKQYLKKDFGVLFIIPNKTSFHYNLDRDVVHKLKILFNRLDCDIDYNNEITDFHKDIFKSKPFYYIDRQITNNKYMEINCEMFTYKSKNILKMEFIHTNNIKNIDVNASHYFWMEGSSKTKQDDLIKKYDYKDWAINIEDYSKLEPHNYSFKVRMMGFDPDTHQSNEDFKKWFNFYSPASDNQYHGAKIEGYGDGIIPYIDDYCLKFATNETQKGYLKQKDFNPNKNLGRSGQTNAGSIPWKRTVENKVITYKPKQNFLCELIESRENINNEKTLLSLSPIKSQSLVCNNKGYQKTIPFFLLWLSHKYIWTTSDVEINELTTEEQLEKSKEETKKEKELRKKAELEKKKEEKEKLLAQQKAEKEEKKKKKAEQEKLLAQQRAEKEEQEKLIAQQRAEKEEQEKLLAQKKAEKEATEKLIAQQKAEEEEQKKLLAQKKAEEEEQKKLIAQQKAEEEEQKKLLAQQKAEKEKQEKILAQQKAEEEKQKKLLVQQKSSKTNQKLLEAAEEINKEKEELENDMENNYISIAEETNIDKGFCYCLKDPSRPNYRKIGKSAKEKEKLLKQYPARYMPEGIDISQWIPFNNSKLAEEHIFEKLKKYRINNTEWFKFDMHEKKIDKYTHEIFSKYKSFMDNNELEEL